MDISLLFFVAISSARNANREHQNQGASMTVTKLPADLFLVRGRKNVVEYFCAWIVYLSEPLRTMQSIWVTPGSLYCWQLTKGETTTIEFVAQTEGKYSFRCCHTCGLGHRRMKGQIVVEQ